MSRARMDGPIGCYRFDAWHLMPEGAAVHVEERTAVIADVHLGYEWARAAAGDCVPAHSLKETLTRLSWLFARTPITRLIVAGDFVESGRPCRQTAADVASLIQWLSDRGASLLLLEGNHDRGLLASTVHGTNAPTAIQDTTTFAGWTIAHGHRSTAGARTVSGHHHPVLRVSGVGAPCFLVSDNQIVLPAFSCNAAGCDVRSAQLPSEWHSAGLRCVVSTGTELLDFGPLSKLRTPARRPG